MNVKKITEVLVNLEPGPLFVGGPDVWGPHFWFLLHWFSDKYLSSKQFHAQSYHDAAWLIRNIHAVIPCITCAQEAYEYGQKHLLLFRQITANPMEYALYWFRFHNFVNRRLNKMIKVKFTRFESPPELSVWWEHCDIVIRSSGEDNSTRLDNVKFFVDFVELIIRACPQYSLWRVMEHLLVLERNNLFDKLQYENNEHQRSILIKKYTIKICDTIDNYIKIRQYKS
ncbi:hypothetical protein [Trichoplusia ni ascovirus 2c]|uniref:hypothetical protein n=1 Tax=Trichoplusia ni ascovirus 2c TaxID=328615 RepID=UPI0000E4424E|nr:hypothetical protein TNAV2c_gp118 [Trichoplusia ni ascovirus 2c]ABF70635.1 hypothetical protein [Trichoplusia ni ascovirus 2c]AUS94225.1 hypothetical protein [Trichoplusia ni ascovirus 6b]